MAPLRPTLAAILAASAMLLPGAAQAQLAQTVQRTMPVTGNAPQVCTIQPARLQAGGLVNFRGLDGDTLQIEELTDKRTLAAKPASATLSFAAVCNFPHRVRIESQNNGLWPTDGRMSTEAEGFAYALPYRAHLDWGSATGDFFADAKVRRLNEDRVSVDVPTAGDLSLRIEIESGASNVRTNAPVLAGVYGDTVRIFLEPR
jgi:hypothetical protein